jgi:glycosyltransferase involved in cell wall biosynthesis
MASVHAADSTLRSEKAPAAPRKPRRILHVVSSLERGGIDLWLMQVLRRIDRDSYQLDFMILNERRGVFEQEALSLGSHIVQSPQRRNPWRLRRDFKRALRRHGPYDVVHGHVHHFNGLVLALAARHGVRCRIAHSHNDTRVVEAGAPWRRRLYLRLTKRWIRHYATQRIAVSRSAAEDLFGPEWRRDSQCRIIPCGIDFAAFAGHASRSTARQGLGLPEDALIIGHVGRFDQRKNHRFLLEIAAELLARNQHACLLLVGDGELMSQIKTRAQQLRIEDRVFFTGDRADIPMLMQAMDVFVLPSIYEGLGLVLLEAQAMGIPCVLSDGLPEEADVLPSLMHRMPLTAPAAAWAELILRTVDAPRPTADQAWKALSESEFTIERSIESLLQVYEHALGGLETNVESPAAVW